MKRVDNNRILFSPSDLITFTRSIFASWMDRKYLDRPEGLTPDPPSEEIKIFQEDGIAHEKKYWAEIQASGVSAVEIPDKSPAETSLEEMKKGPEVIYQACLGAGNFEGFADFLKQALKKVDAIDQANCK